METQLKKEMGEKMKLGLLWHGDCTITVHNTNCKDFHKPDKKRSSGLETGIIYDCIVDLDSNIHKVVSDNQKLFDILYDWLPSSVLGNTELEYMNCTKNKKDN